MSTITVKDGTTIYYKDWGKGPVVTFSHGWPLSSDAWDSQMLFLFSKTDFHEDLKRFDVPKLVMHGEDDQIVPIARKAVA